MHWLTENPTPLVCIGIVLIFCLVALFFYSPNKKLILPIGIAFLLAIIPIVIDALVETEREQLQRTVREMARQVRANDIEGLLDFIHPDARTTRYRIENEMPQYKFSACSVSGFKSITIDESNPDQAEVRFSVFVNVNAPTYNYNGPTYRDVVLRFVRVGQHINTGRDLWLVNGFNHYRAGGMRATPP